MDQEGVLYVGPVSDRETLLAYYRSADLFLLPSRCDSFGFVFLEAMTQGLICVGSRMNAMPEIIAEGETGYLVEPGDFEGLAEVIIRCYQRPELRVEMGRRAADRVVEKFSWPRVVAEMQSVMFQPEVSSGTASSFDTCSMSRPGEGPFLAVHRERGN
jgi:glycosyltransferase involved in cell wall biosynthesis